MYIPCKLGSAEVVKDIPVYQSTYVATERNKDQVKFLNGIENFFNRKGRKHGTVP